MLRKAQVIDKFSRAEAGDNKEDIGEAKFRYNSELFFNYEQQEALFTKKRIKKAEWLRVHIPAKPNLTYENGFRKMKTGRS